MANFRSFLADLTDPTFTTAEVDLNAYETGGGPFETDTDTLDLGAPEMDGVWLNEAGKDEDVLSAHRRGRVEASFALRIGPKSTNTLTNLNTALRDLNRALDRSGVWVLQQPGLTTPLYIDYYPSPLIQQLMPGERTMFHLWTQLQQPNGMRVTILRRPKMRGAALDAALNLAHNGTLAEDHDADGIPTCWEWDFTTGLSALTYDWTFGAHVALFNTAVPKYFFQTADADVIEAGHTYTFAADVAATYGLKPTVKARIDWLDGDGDQIGASVYGSAVGSLFSPRMEFARPAILGAVASAGAVSARYGIEVTCLNTSTVTFYTRNAQLQVGLAASDFRPGFETVSNDSTQPFGKRIWLTNAANADALGQLRVTPDTGGSVARMVYARRSGERDSAMAMRVLPGWHAADSSVLMNGTTVVSDGGRTVAKTALSDDVMRAVFRQEVTQTEESALRGTWHLRAALRGDLSDAYSFEIRHGVGDVVDLPHTLTRHTLDLTGPPAESDYYVVDLGMVFVPSLSPGLYLELWARRDTTDDGDGDGELYIEQLWIEPADDDLYAIAVVPGAQRSGPVVETVVGKKLITPPDGLTDDPDTSDPFVAGSVYNDDMLLNDLLEAASLKAGLTDDLTPGVAHTYVVDVTMFTQSEKVSRKHGEFRIHDLNTDLQVTQVVIKNTAGAAWDTRSFTVKFTPVAGHAYLVYVVQTVDVAVGNIHTEAIHHTFVPPIEGGDETIAIDADQRRAYVLKADQFKSDLDFVPPFPVFRPNVQLLRLSFAGLGSNGSDDVLDGGPGLSHDPTLTALVGVHTIPRWWN